MSKRGLIVVDLQNEYLPTGKSLIRVVSKTLNASDLGVSANDARKKYYKERGMYS